jgi:hypothetical protein
MTAIGATLTRGRMVDMTTTETDPLTEVQAAYRKRRDLARRLADQDRYIGSVVRQAKASGQTWAAIAKVAGTSDVAVLKAARRKDTS